MDDAHEGFLALLELKGQEYRFDGVDGDVLPGGLDTIDFSVTLKQGESYALSLRVARDMWDGGLPEVGSYLTRVSDSKKARVAGKIDDGVSSTVILAIAL